MKNGRHAYLIMAHNNFYILEKLVKLLDDTRNDIYIHIDKKTSGFDFDKFKKMAKKSNMIFVQRTNVQWGGYSQINCELVLLKAATLANYDYYHLISGVDLPLKTQDYIHDFFDKNYGKEFIHYDRLESDANNNGRIKYYHFLQEFLRRPNIKPVRNIIRIINRAALSIQGLIGVNRIQGCNIQLQKGASWYSITDALARYILSQEAVIKKMYRFSNCSDEVFIQTLVWNSEYRLNLYDRNFDNNYKSCMRFIDWDRGGPYVWRMDDFNSLIDTDYLFARKFDLDIDFNIVEKIYNHINKIQQLSLV